MEKAEGAFLTIGELSAELGLPQHVLRYWETRFPQLRPLQRSGNRRYYRPADVALTRRIHHLLSVEGFTVRGALKALEDDVPGNGAMPASPVVAQPVIPDEPEAQQDETPIGKDDALIVRLEAIRARLAEALGLPS